MIAQTMTRGPDTAPAGLIDRTQILDAKEIWSDPLLCPDWPHLPGNMRYDGVRGRAGAEQRLQTVGFLLNRGEGKLRAPTADERAVETTRMFRSDRAGKWSSLGIRALSPLGLGVEGQADLMVEACHLRGYLRKLDATAEQAAKDEKRLKDAEARRTLENYRTTAPTQIDEIKSLAEAVARHEQRIADEQAVSRSLSLRQSLNAKYQQAVSAAHDLGLGVPDAPDFL